MELKNLINKAKDTENLVKLSIVKVRSVTTTYIDISGTKEEVFALNKTLSSEGWRFCCQDTLTDKEIKETWMLEEEWP